MGFLTWCWLCLLSLFIQRYGQGPNDPLSLESSGDFTRKFGYLNIGAYDVPKGTNLLNNVWYQPEEVYPVTGVPEVRQHVFFLPVDEKLYETAKKLVVRAHIQILECSLLIYTVRLMLCINITFMNESFHWCPLLVKQHLEWVLKKIWRYSHFTSISYKARIVFCLFGFVLLKMK